MECIGGGIRREVDLGRAMLGKGNWEDDGLKVG